ncbi:hypothetical protein Glove_231g22 [Diversispora epigaea]|uniref:Uncharacterized protein n=1 Tax=Diversispora epigaea TaxID=1348612 RepID=A0A397IC12_9GLOM|nr:hypothetical protein Glove_231g22 [Diversispora epigaea]
MYDSRLDKQWSGKLDTRWKGPFTISKCLDKGAYALKNQFNQPLKELIHHQELYKGILIVKYKEGDKILMYDSRLDKQWSGKLDTRWKGPFTITETQKEITLLMVIAKRRNDCVDEAIKQKNEAISEIVERELSREEKDPNYEVTYTLKDLNRVKDHLDLIKHHVWIRDNILVDNGRTVFNIPTRRTVQRLTPEEREQRRQRYQQRQLERQIQRENQNPVTVRLPASNSTTTSPSATVETSETTPRQRRRSNETPQSFSQAVSPRQSPEQVTPRVVTPPNNWDQLQNIRTFYQPIDFNLLNQQLAEAHLTASDSSDSSDTDTEDEMANTVLDYLEDNLHNHTSLRVDPFYRDGTQDPLQWMLHFEKVARSNAWDEAKKIRKYATYLEDDAEE